MVTLNSGNIDLTHQNFVREISGKATECVGECSNISYCALGPASVHPVIHFGEVGGSATFTCNATGVPGQSFSWMRPNGQMKSKEVGHGERITINSDTGSSKLTLQRTSVVDSGYYICDATVNINQPNSGLSYLQLCKFYFITFILLQLK